MPWHIYEDREGRWHWELVDAQQAILKQSGGSFSDRFSCVADAEKHGFTGEHGGPLDHGTGPSHNNREG